MGHIKAKHPTFFPQSDAGRNSVLLSIEIKVVFSGENVRIGWLFIAMGGANDAPQEGSDIDIVDFDSSVGLGFANRTANDDIHALTFLVSNKMG